MIEVIALTGDRFLAVAWKNGSVHNMWLTTSSAVAQTIAELGLTRKPATDDVYENIEKLVKKISHQP